MSVPDNVLDTIIRPQAKQVAVDASLALLGSGMTAIDTPSALCYRYELMELEFLVCSLSQCIVPVVRAHLTFTQVYACMLLRRRVCLLGTRGACVSE